LIAFCHRRQAVIEFKLDRIRQADLLDESYTIPADFDLEAYLGDGWGLMRGRATEPQDVELLFEPEAGRWVAEEHWHKSQQAETLPDGRVRMTFRVGVTPEFVNWIMYYGSRVQVVRPEALRAQVAEELRKAARRYE
jgi:predicted DNA-binding transcriptional regulator YafY